MIDAARTVETMEHYYKTVDFCADNGLNTILFRVTDDEGSALQLQSHPELLHQKGAFTAAELKKFVAYASKKGVEIIPEVEPFGHTRYITSIDKYKFLTDIGDPTITWSNGICPVSDTTLNLMQDLFIEIAEIFPSKYFHIGCDETNWGSNPMTIEALKEKSKNQIWAEYVNKLNAIAKKMGKTSIIWADVPIREENEILEMLDKDIVLMDWNYWVTDEDKIKTNADMMMNYGFRIIGAPAINWMMWGPRIGEFQLKNMETISNVYNNLDNEKNLGVLFTHWEPYRYTQNAQWDTYTLAAEMVNNPNGYDMMATLKKFTEAHYGVVWNEEWDKVYTDLYKNTPKNKLHGLDVEARRFYPWKNKEDLAYIYAKKEPFENNFIEITNLLKKQRKEVKKNKQDFDEFLLSVEYIEHIIWRENALLVIRDDESKMVTTLEEIVETDSAMLARLDAVWEKGRKGKMKDKHVWEFPKAAAYSAKLTKDNSELKEVLKNLAK